MKLTILNDGKPPEVHEGQMVDALSFTTERPALGSKSASFFLSLLTVGFDKLC